MLYNLGYVSFMETQLKAGRLDCMVSLDGSHLSLADRTLERGLRRKMVGLQFSWMTTGIIKVTSSLTTSCYFNLKLKAVVLLPYYCTSHKDTSKCMKCIIIIIIIIPPSATTVAPTEEMKFSFHNFRLNNSVLSLASLGIFIRISLSITRIDIFLSVCCMFDKSVKHWTWSFQALMKTCTSAATSLLGKSHHLGYLIPVIGASFRSCHFFSVEFHSGTREEQRIKQGGGWKRDFLRRQKWKGSCHPNYHGGLELEEMSHIKHSKPDSPSTILPDSPWDHWTKPLGNWSRHQHRVHKASDGTLANQTETSRWSENQKQDTHSTTSYCKSWCQLLLI